jgi:hypothetical protein
MPNKKDAFHFFDSNSSHIEVLDENKNIHTIYFAIDPCFYHLDKYYKHSFWLSCDLSNAQEFFGIFIQYASKFY